MTPLRLFQGFGVELEYMIVDARTLAVRPQADRLIRRVTGDVQGDVMRGALATLVAGLRYPTIRRSFVVAREVLRGAGREDLAHELLRLLGRG